MVALLLLLACEIAAVDSEAQAEHIAAPDPTVATGSTSMVASKDGAALYAVSADDGIVVRFDIASGAAASLSLPGEPSRIARMNGRIYVTLRAERAVVELVDDGGILVEVNRATVGTEPLGVVASPSGERLYVALSTQEQVVQLDADLAIERTFSIGGHPSWLALHPNGEVIYVAAQVGGGLWALDLRAEVPTPTLMPFPQVIGAGREADLPYSQRITGDLSVDSSGTWLGVPALFVDNKTPPKHSIEEAEQGDPSLYYDSIGLGLSPNNPTVALFGLDDEGLPDGGVVLLYAVGLAPNGDTGEDHIVRSFLSNIAFSPDGTTAYGCMEGSETVVALATDAAGFSTAYGDFVATPSTWYGTDAGPRGLAFAGGDRPFVYNFLDRSIGELGETARMVVTPTLDPDVDLGRSLYYSAVNPHMSTSASGISCSTCHFEGRNDGLTWPLLGEEFRQTLSLAGPVSLSPPFTWSNNVETVEEEVRLTSQVRLGGRELSDEQLAAVAAFVEYIRDVDHPEKGTASEAALRGRALFERGDVGCADCHSGPRLSDNDVHDLYGVEGINTPILIGVTTTAPYLHDGSAETLRDVLETTRVGAMGDTSMLSGAELEDLEAYLRAL